ncbi:hypothetical protein L6164_026527 [Bauhinia variegata]|uniref:Uncharacterized protein n=1 Tax=Bauhinia variegata TaxID=167791 RepID=A0ACB9LQ25_BAUVA|nr:hypothetical protein L6164_026527 [Bauhinia variegata]
MGNSGSTEKIAIAAASVAVAAIVAGGLYSRCSSSALSSHGHSCELDSEKSKSPSVTNSHNSTELDIVQSNSSCPVSNSEDFDYSDSVESSSGSFPISHGSGLIDLLSGSGTIGWQFPPIGWVKCNVDGSSRKAQHSAGCGGVYRDGQGKWVNGFARKLGYCSSMKAEILAIYTGLAEAWRLGFRNLIIESDSKSAVDLVNRGCSASGKLAKSIKKARKYLRKEWQVNIVYIPREYNGVADWLSKFSHEFHVGLHELKKPPKGCSKFLLEDESYAVCFPRSIIVSYSSF